VFRVGGTANYTTGRDGAWNGVFVVLIFFEYGGDFMELMVYIWEVNIWRDGGAL
jgi:hypothetical protein